MSRSGDALIVRDASGFYCPEGGFHVDPGRRTDGLALITHAHSDHARPGCAAYLCSESCRDLLRLRVGKRSRIETLSWGETITIKGLKVSLHPAGHILGSAQIRVEYRGQVWVVSGDYATLADPSCEPAEPVTCDTFVSEATFGSPLFSWDAPESVFEEILRWWDRNRDLGTPSLLLAYSLGKTQRLLCGLRGAIGPILLHPSAVPFTEAYKEHGVPLAAYEVWTVGEAIPPEALLIAPPQAQVWVPASRAFVSGWTCLRRSQRQSGVEMGFTLSDHADWKGLLSMIRATGASAIKVVHSPDDLLVRYLQSLGQDAEWWGASLQ